MLASVRQFLDAIRRDMMARMKHAWILTTALAAMLTYPAFSHAQEPSAGHGTLRCDPGVVIKSIDGKEEIVKAGNDKTFVDCAIPLAPGFHELETCHEIHTGDLVAECKETSLLQLTAKAGGAYRVRLALDPRVKEGWRAFLEDVTESEAQYTFAKPAKKPKPSGSKKGLETVLVLGATPQHAWLFLEKGQVFGKWFTYGSLFGPLRSKGQSTSGVPGGYHIVKVTGGDTVALTGGRMMEGSIFVAKGMHPCGDFPLRVYEDLPAGKVLYLGHLNVKTGPFGYVGQYSDDLEATRKFLAQREPELAQRLEPASFRLLSVADVCYGRGYDLKAP